MNNSIYQKEADRKNSFAAKLAAKFGVPWENENGWRPAFKANGYRIEIEDHGHSFSHYDKKLRCKVVVHDLYSIKAREPYTLVPFNDTDENVELAFQNLTTKVMPKAKELEGKVAARRAYQNKANQQAADYSQRCEDAIQNCGFEKPKYGKFVIPNGLNVDTEISSTYGRLVVKVVIEPEQLKAVLESLATVPQKV